MKVTIKYPIFLFSIILNARITIHTKNIFVLLSTLFTNFRDLISSKNETRFQQYII